MQSALLLLWRLKIFSSLLLWLRWDVFINQAQDIEAFYYLHFKQTPEYLVWKQLKHDAQHSGAALLRGKQKEFMGIIGTWGKHFLCMQS